jgi:hypothetical protein
MKKMVNVTEVIALLTFTLLQNILSEALMATMVFYRNNGGMRDI